MGINNYSIDRLGDRSFGLNSSSEGLLSKFHVKSNNLKAETSYYLTEKAIQRYTKQLQKYPNRKFKTIRFRYAGRKWKLVQKPNLANDSWILKFFKIIFFHKPAEIKPQEFEIESAWFAGKSKVEKVNEKAREVLKKDLPKCSLRHNYQSLKNEMGKNQENANFLGNITINEYSQGVRGKISLYELENNSWYSDPYTKLSSWAFERFEPHLKSKDNSNPLDCKYRLIVQDNTLLLVHKKSPLATSQAMKQAGDLYTSFMEKFYGQEKIAYIKHLYKLKKDSFKELTPDHIFRMNCGTTNIEIQDIELGVNSLQKLLEQLKNEEESGCFEDAACNRLPEFLMIGVIKSLSQYSSKPKPTIADFKHWMNHKISNSKIQNFTNEQFNQLIKIFRPNVEDLDAAFTGKKILNVIRGSYESGECEQFKPWIDQQELTQTFLELENSSSFESYLEKLSHVVVKKHLVRKHPIDGLRVGALIPAPPKFAGGEIRWYKVSSCLTNEYNYSYTLESACNDKSLPLIKLCRNTAPSSYAVYSTKSIMNDLSLLNAPGYMGINMLDEEEEAFFNKRTIPLWVGYRELAEKKMQGNAPYNEIHALLEKANQALLKSEKEKYKKLSFREVLKKHDVILNELYFRNEQIYNFKGKNLSPAFLSLFKKLVNRYINISNSKYNKISIASINKDKKALTDLLEKMKASEKDKRIGLLLTNLIDDLYGKKDNEHLLNLTNFMENQYNSLNQYSVNPKNQENLQLWSNHLNQLAINGKENIDSKEAYSIVFAGQSLGGALAQVMLTRYITNKDRMMLPDCSCTLAEFDAPAINAEDNQKFLTFGKENKSLFRALGIQFSIFRRQEVGDVVPGVGEEHLGSVLTEQESNELQKEDSWLKFDAAINKRYKSSKSKDIALSETVHDTLFLEGKNVAHGSIFLKKNKLKIKVVKDKDIQYDYKELKFNPHIQGIFNSHGKKGDIKGLKGRRIYRSLYHDIWKFPRFQFLNESFRKSTDYVACCIRRMLLAKRHPDRTLKTKDLIGRVVVRYECTENHYNS